MKIHFLIFGFGYTSHFLATKLILQGFNVTGTSRTLDLQRKDDFGVNLIDFNSPNIQEHIDQSTHLLISIPPTDTMTDLVLSKYSELIKRKAHLQWLGYLSSTGVYGDHGGNWVNENSPCIPHTPTAIARLKAEQAWLSFAQENQLPLHVFRLSGIYGPGRNSLERILRGKKQSILKEGQVFSRIHVEDIVSSLLASMKYPKPQSIYNLSDDEPAPAHIVDNYAATLLNREPLPVVPFSESQLSSMEQEFYSNNRRVSNLKIKEELKVILKFPTYREGLTQIWRESFAPK